MLAIGKALAIIQNQNISKAIIFSDSLSALTTLKYWKIDSSTDTITATVKKIWAELINENKIIKGVWVPSHSEIIGNDKADQLANHGRCNGKMLNYKGGPKLMYNIVQKRIKKDWIEELQEWGRNKGRTYTHMRNRDKEDLLEKPFSLIKYNIPRKQITTMMGPRSGHCMSPEHLYRIGVKTTPNCECGEIGSIRHIFLECTLNVHNINTLYKKLEKFKFQRPINLNEVIFTKNVELIQIINDFLEHSKIKI